MRNLLRAVALIGLAGVVACGDRGCIYTRPAAPPPWRVVEGEDGAKRRLVSRGAYDTYYDMAGGLERIEYDSNNDGRADYVARFEGLETPTLLEVDSDFDGAMDRWEYYDAAGELVKVGYSEGTDRPRRWLFVDANGLPRRIEHDSDADQAVDRVELFVDGRLVSIEVDSNRDGRMDRWQDWRSGVLAGEDIDTDADGKPDQRLRYGPGGGVEGIEPLPAR